MDSLPTRPHGKKRPSQSQQRSHWPSWAKSEGSYRRTIENPPNRPINREDYGEDNFAYYGPYVEKAGFSSDLHSRLPKTLAEQAKLFVLAYAAVHTALDRIKLLDKEAPDRIDPKTTHTHLIHRRISDQTPAVVGAETLPSSSSPDAQKLSIPTPFTPAGSRKALTLMIPQLPVNMMGLESPPFTPVDSKVANTPVNEPLAGPKGMVETDLARVSAELSKTALTLSSAGLSVKNESAWRTYVGQYNAEIDDVQNHAFKRLEGYIRFITKEFFERMHDEGLTREDKVALQEFRAWWLSMLKKVSVLETKVVELEEKALGTRTELQALDMKAAAWPL